MRAGNGSKPNYGDSSRTGQNDKQSGFPLGMTKQKSNSSVMALPVPDYLLIWAQPSCFSNDAMEFALVT